MASTIVPTQNGHTLTIAQAGDTVAIRIAKDGHNRAIAKFVAGGANLRLIIDALTAIEAASDAAGEA